MGGWVGQCHFTLQGASPQQVLLRLHWVCHLGLQRRNPYHLSSWNQPTGKGVNAGLRAQAGGPLGLSWGLPGLHLFWKQRKKNQKAVVGRSEGLLGPTHTSGGPRGLGTALTSPSPTVSCAFQSRAVPPSPQHTFYHPVGSFIQAGTHGGLFSQDAWLIYSLNTIFLSGNSWRPGMTVESGLAPTACLQ